MSENIAILIGLIAKGSENEINDAIDSGKFNLSESMPNGITPLIIACLVKKPNVALKLIETENSAPDKSYILGDTALIIACKEKMEDVALVLIDKMEVSNLGHESGNYTALHYALNNNMTNVALKLIEKQQNLPEFKSSDQFERAMDLAKTKNLTEVIETLENIKKIRQPRKVSQEKIEIEIDINDEGFNMLTQENVNISEYLKEPGNICFKIGPKYFVTSKEILSDQLKNDANIKYECKQNARLYETDDINKDKEYFSLGFILGSIKFLVDRTQIINIIKSKLKTNNFFELVPTGKIFPSIMSKEFYNYVEQMINDGENDFNTDEQGEEMLTKSDHCQEGKESEVYDIIPVKVKVKKTKKTTTSKTSKIQNISQEKEPLKEIKIQYKEKVFSFPVTQTTTLGDIKTELLNKLLVENMINSIDQNVKFIFGGKMYTDSSINLTSIKSRPEDPPFGITLNVMITPKVGGKKTKKNRKINNKYRKTKKIKKHRKTKKHKK